MNYRRGLQRKCYLFWPIFVLILQIKEYIPVNWFETWWFFLLCLRFSDFGCMLEILSLEVLPDGRSFVEALGVSRFKVLRRGQRDGYSTADIEYLEDLKVPEMILKATRKYSQNITTWTSSHFSSCLCPPSRRLKAVSWRFWRVSMTGCTSRLRTGTSAWPSASAIRSAGSTAPCQRRTRTCRLEHMWFLL